MNGPNTSGCSVLQRPRADGGVDVWPESLQEKRQLGSRSVRTSFPATGTLLNGGKLPLPTDLKDYDDDKPRLAIADMPERHWVQLGGSSSSWRGGQTAEGLCGNGFTQHARAGHHQQATCIIRRGLRVG